jgi:hypothetical protein
MNSESPTDNQQPKPDTGTEPNKQSNNPKPEVPSAATQPQAKPSPHSYKITCDKKRDWIDKATLGLEGFGLFVLIVYTIFTGLMWYANKKAADAAKSAADTAHDALVRSNRPWIGVSQPVIPVFKEHELREYSINYKNFGVSPGIKIFVGAMPYSSLDMVKVHQRYLCDSLKRYTTESTPHGTALFPGMESSQGISIAPGVNKVSLDPEMPLYLAGCISYWDQFPLHHETTFCLQTSGALKTYEIGKPLVSCNDYNDAN